MTEERQDRDRDDGDQEEQERVLHHRLPLFAIAGRSERQRRPRRKRTKHVHYPSPSSELAWTRTLFGRAFPLHAYPCRWVIERWRPCCFREKSGSDPAFCIAVRCVDA